MLGPLRVLGDGLLLSAELPVVDPYDVVSGPPGRKAKPPPPTLPSGNHRQGLMVSTSRIGTQPLHILLMHLISQGKIGSV
jgi:hypothetical protein